MNSGSTGLDVPLEWSDVLNIIKDGSPDALGRLGRAKSELQTYRQFRAELREKYVSVGDYIKISKLDFPSAQDEGKLKAVDPDSQHRIVSFVLNDFPYYFSPDIGHHLLWSTVPLNADEVAAEITKYLPKSDIMWFVNFEIHSSIPAVWHCHVISRPRKDGCTPSPIYFTTPGSSGSLPWPV